MYSISDPNVAFLIINSNVKHQLEGSEYSSRRQQCEQVAKFFKKSFREITLSDLNGLDCVLIIRFHLEFIVRFLNLLEKQGQLDSDSYRRAKHAVTEIDRTIRAAKALESNDLTLFGQLMNQSHDSLR
jgi:galactokinase